MCVWVKLFIFYLFIQHVYVKLLLQTNILLCVWHVSSTSLFAFHLSLFIYIFFRKFLCWCWVYKLLFFQCYCQHPASNANYACLLHCWAGLYIICAVSPWWGEAENWAEKPVVKGAYNGQYVQVRKKKESNIESMCQLKWMKWTFTYFGEGYFLNINLHIY